MVEQAAQPQIHRPSAQRTHSNPNHSIGHCRAQRFAMDFHFDDAWEREKAAITSYEENWDDWDGPIWPWREANHPLHEDEYEGCCTPPEKTPAGTPQEEKVHKELWKAANPTGSKAVA